MKQSIVTTLLEYKHDLGFLTFCILSTSIIRAYISTDERSLLGIALAFLCVLPVGLVAGYMAIDYSLPDSVVILIACSVGFFGNSLLRGAIANEGYFGTLIKRGMENLLEKFTGK